MEVRIAKSQADFDAARGLFQEHADSLGEHFCFIGFEEELATIDRQYAPPGGMLLLAGEGADTAGCIAYRDQGAGVCEMKRLYLRPQFRGKGVGRRLVERLIEEAKSAGFERMILDTLPSMEAAYALYRDLGFTETDAYNDNPICGVKFLALDL